MKILLVEDEPDTAALLDRGLKEAGYVVEVARDGIAGLDMASEGAFDALIVDRMLPRLDGLLMIETLRRTGRDMPILILSALADVEDRIKGLRAGGDDYMAKPYSLAEVLARLEALSRRRNRPTTSPGRLRVGHVELDRASRTVRSNGEVVALQPREYHLLDYLMAHCGQVATRSMLLEAVWDYDFDPKTNVIDVHISRLRQKLGDTAATFILTVRGAGYMIRRDD